MSKILVPPKTRRCQICRKPGHYRNHCPTAMQPPTLDAPPDGGDEAMRTMLIEPYAVWLVEHGETGTALANCVASSTISNAEGYRKLMAVALAELHKRAQKISPSVLTKAHAAREAYDKALVVLEAALEPIRVELGYRVTRNLVEPTK
jgi:hypothetical protein